MVAKGGNIMNKKYGYCRISTKKQNIERQERNIKTAFPDATIIHEVFTGTKFQGRNELDKLLKVIHKEDTIIFDSVSRMSRNADEGFALYEELFYKGVNLVFLKEPHINTDTYKTAMQNQVALTGGMVDAILKGINEYLMLLAKEQIKIAFAQSEKEVEDLHQRTREGIETARRNGKQIGQKNGAKLTTKKSLEAKKKIQQYNKDFNGTLNNEDTMKLIGISHNSFYKYKRELSESIEG